MSPSAETEGTHDTTSASTPGDGQADAAASAAVSPRPRSRSTAPAPAAPGSAARAREAREARAAQAASDAAASNDASDSTTGDADANTAARPERSGGVARRARSIRAASGVRGTAKAATPPASTRNGSDIPVVIPADAHGINGNLISRNAVRVTDGLQQAGFRAFIVGGAVRDLLFGVAPKDFDVATDATPEQVQRLFRRARIIGRRFQIVHVQFGQEIIEVSTFRAMVDPTPTPDTAAADDAATAEADASIVAAAAESGRGNVARTTVVPNEHGDNHRDDADTDHPASPDHDDVASVDGHDGTDDGDDAQEAHDDPAGAHRGQQAPRGQNGDGRKGDRRNRRRREDPDRRLHAVDASGRVVRDNVWGQQHEDARRRDFTINAMYYDPSSQTVLDYHEGMADIRARTLRMIGDPETRYREDPVRMLRVVRFAAKLGFDIEPATREPIAAMADLLNNVPAARIFDEMLKLLLSGHALACLTKLRTEGLHQHLLPMLDSALSEPTSEKFITLSLSNTDQRIRAGKPVSPGFLFAALLWHETQRSWKRYMAAGELPIPALHRAMDEVMNAQTGKLAIQRRFVTDMKEIWGMQPRLEKRAGRSALKLLEHPKFRAAYDFLLLRCESEELELALGQWWTDFITGDFEARETLLNNSPREAGPRARPRRRRRRGGQGRQDGGQEGDGGADVPTPTV